MPLRNSAEAYGSLSKFLHWAIVLLIIPQYFLAEAAGELPEGDPQIAQLYGVHKSIGLLVLILAVVRVVWKLANRPNPALTDQVVWRRRTAAASHGLLYLLIFLQPLTGWAMSSAAGREVSLFGWVTFPPLVGENHQLHETLESVHEWLFYVLLGVAVVHILAAIYHHVVLKDDTLRRMLPFSRAS
jgi:cytochrome b561